MGCRRPDCETKLAVGLLFQVAVISRGADDLAVGFVRARMNIPAGGRTGSPPRDAVLRPKQRHARSPGAQTNRASGVVDLVALNM